MRFRQTYLGSALVLLGWWGAASAFAAITDIYSLRGTPDNNLYLVTGGGTGNTIVYTNYPGGSAATLAMRPSDGVLFYVVNASNGAVYKWDPATPATAPVSLGSVGSGIAAGLRLAFAPDGTLYYMPDDNVYRVSQTTGTATLAYTITGTGAGGDMAFAPDGTLYIAGNSTLYKFVPPLANGAATTVGNFTGFSSGSEAAVGLAWDRANARLLVLTSDASTSGYYSVNTNSAACTRLGNASGGADTGDLGSAPVPLSADVAVAKNAPATVNATNQLVYTIAVTNNGPAIATSLVVTDSLPANVTFLSATSGGTTNASLTNVVWAITSLASGAVTNLGVTVKAPASGVISNFVAAGSAISDPTPGNNQAGPVITTVTGFPGGVSGTVYLDANHNAQRDATENGTGLTLFAKLIGAVTNVATVTAGSGSYTFTNLPPGTYTVLVSTNNSLADLTASIPAGWIGTEAPAQLRPTGVVLASNVPNQNFGLFNGARLSGKVFADTGAGGGTANDGVPGGGEPGVPGVTVKLTDNTGAVVYDTAVTDGAGNYSLAVPAGAGALTVVETNRTGYVSTGAGVGNTGGAYTRATDAIAFTSVASATYTNVNFGDVPGNGFLPDNQQTALPGAVVWYAHTFQAGSAGAVTLSASHTANPNVPGWNEILFLDANCDAVLDTNAVAVTAPIAVNAGQVVCLLVKEIVPANAPLNAQNRVTVTAAFSYTGAAPGLAATNTVTDLTTVGVGNGTGLSLTKTVDKPTALPGDLITYSIIYSNNSSGSLTNLFITDATPPYTAFVGASAAALPLTLTAVSITAPASNSTGNITWRFSGNLAPAAGGSVTFQVKVAQ